MAGVQTRRVDRASLFGLGAGVSLAVAGWVTVLGALSEAGDLRWFGDLVVAHDFAQHHAAGELWRTGGPGSVYAPEALGRTLVELHGISRSTTLFARSGYLYPPPVAWLASVICPADYWSAVVGFWVITGVAGLLAIGWAAWLFRVPNEPAWIRVIWGLAFPSFIAAFLYGQPASLALLAVVAAGWAASRGRPWLGGLCLACLAVKPTWLIGLLPVLCVAGFGRLALAAMVITMGGGFLSLGLLGGWDTHSDWWKVATGHQHNQATWILSGSLPGFVAACLPKAPGWLTWGLFGGCLAVFCFWRRWLFPKDHEVLRRWATALTLSALGSPYLLHYDLVFLIPLMMAVGNCPARWLFWLAALAGFIGPEVRLPVASLVCLIGVRLTVLKKTGLRNP